MRSYEFSGRLPKKQSQFRQFSYKGIDISKNRQFIIGFINNISEHFSDIGGRVILQMHVSEMIDISLESIGAI